MAGNKEEKMKDERICPICLHVWSDPTVLDNCTHIFCFECIIEWTRLKPECPLCKCALQLVKHHLQQSSRKDRQLPNWETVGQIENVIELRSEHELNQIMKVSAVRRPDAEKHTIIQVAKSLMGELHSLRSLSITTYASEAIYRRAIDEIDAELNEYKHLLNIMNQGASRAVLFNEPAFRRIVYKKNLMPNSICPPMFNVTFNKDYIQNHRETVRSHIMPFIVREVTALTRKDALDIGTYLDRLLEYFTGKIKRQAIVNFLSKNGIENPHQFVNNLLHYASTGQTMRVYDQNSEYTQRLTNFVGAFFPEDDDVLILNSNNNSDVQVIGESRNNRTRQAQNNQQDGEPAMINNNLLLDHFQQQQQSTSSAHDQEGTSDDNSGHSSSLMAKMRQMLENFTQPNRRQVADYFYTPPMPAGHPAHSHHHHQQHLPSHSQQSSSSSSMPDFCRQPTFSKADTNVQQEANQQQGMGQKRDHDSSSILLADDSEDDGVECIGVVPKKRCEMPETDDNNDEENINNNSNDDDGNVDDDDVELELMDEDNEE